MSQKTTQIHPFITHLQMLAEKENRGALAALRRGLGQPPGGAPEMFRYVESYLAERRSIQQEAAYYLVASLFGLHPESTQEGNLGAHLAQTRTQGGEEALDRRFTALLAAHAEDLPNYLRQVISFLKSKNIPVNWNQLLWDLQDWDREDHRVQKRWANAFWGNHTPTDQNQ